MVLPGKFQGTCQLAVFTLITLASLWSYGFCFDFLDPEKVDLKSLPLSPSAIAETINSTLRSLQNSKDEPAAKQVEEGEKKEDVTFEPDVVLFNTSDLTTTAEPPSTDSTKLISMDEAEKLKNSEKPEIQPIPFNSSALPSAEPITNLPPHNLTKEPDSIDVETRKLFDREDVQPHKTTGEKSA